MNYSPKKYRVWDTKLKIFIPWNCFIRFDDPEYIVQAFTGHYDKNQKELYEGHIVSWCSTVVGDFKRVARIGFYHGAYRMMYKTSEMTPAWYDCFSESRLLGNICENPELLA